MNNKYNPITTCSKLKSSSNIKIWITDRYIFFFFLKSDVQPMHDLSKSIWSRCHHGSITITSGITNHYSNEWMKIKMLLRQWRRSKPKQNKTEKKSDIPCETVRIRDGGEESGAKKKINKNHPAVVRHSDGVIGTRNRKIRRSASGAESVRRRDHVIAGKEKRNKLYSWKYKGEKTGAILLQRYTSAPEVDIWPFCVPWIRYAFTSDDRIILLRQTLYTLYCYHTNYY